MSEITYCYYCIYRHCTREGCSVSTRKLNTKKSSPHIRTAPSVLKGAGETYKDPSVHYKEKVCSSTTHEATLKPRNPRQVKNAQAQARKGKGYTQDDLFNLVELTYDIQD